MAKIRDYTVTEVTTASANPQALVQFPEHKTNDYIMLMLAVDGVNIPALPTGYTNIINRAGAAQAYRLCYKKVTGADNSETCPALSVTAEEWHIGVFAISGAAGTSPIDVSAERTTTDNASPFTWTSGASTTTNNCLIFQFINSDTGLSLTCRTNGYTNLINGDSGTAGFGCAYRFQPTSGAILDAVWDGNTNDDTTAGLVAWKDDGNGTRPAYADATTSGTFISSLGGTSLIESDTNPASLTYGAIGIRDFNQMWAFDGTATFTDETTDINNVGTADVTITNAIGAIWYFGYDYKFNHMVLQISTASNGGTIVWEYWNGSAWTTLTVAGVLTATGWARFTWTMPTNMASTAINSVTKFYVRMRVSATFTTAPILSRGHVGGWLTTFDAIANAPDSGVNPYRDAISLTPAQTSNFSGSERQFGSSKDMDTGIVIIHHRATLPRDYAVDPSISDLTYPITQVGRDGSDGALSGYAGMLVVFADADSEYEAYSVHSKESLSNSNSDYNVAAIGINDGAMSYGLIGTLNKSAVTRMLFLPQGTNGALGAYFSSLSIISKIVFAGGDSTNPMNVNDLRFIANNCVGSTFVFNGVGDFNRIYVPIQFGGGDAIKTNVRGAIFQFPTRYNGKEYTDWNANDNVAGVQFYGTGSSDELKFPNCIWKGSQPFRWEFNASHSASAVLDFTGNTIEGATVTLRSTVTLSDVTFNSCPTFTLNSAAISNSSFSNTKVSIATPADAQDITNSTFTSSGTGHAMEISGTAADITLTGLDFTGYAGTNGSTGNEAIYVNIPSGSMTITIEDGTTPSIRTAGASVTVVTGQVTTLITVKDVNTLANIQNARVYLIADSGGPLADGTVIFNDLTNASGQVSDTRSLASDQPVVGWVRKSSSAPFYKNSPITATIDSTTGLSLTVQMIPDE